MKIEFKPTDGPRRPCHLPYEGAKFVEPKGECPSCGASPWKLIGGEPERGHDTYTCIAGCTACKTIVGQIVVTVSTIFGIEEDEAVFGDRCRVY